MSNLSDRKFLVLFAGLLGIQTALGLWIYRPRPAVADVQPSHKQVQIAAYNKLLPIYEDASCSGSQGMAAMESCGRAASAAAWRTAAAVADLHAK